MDRNQEEASAAKNTHAFTSHLFSSFIVKCRFFHCCGVSTEIQFSMEECMEVAMPFIQAGKKTPQIQAYDIKESDL